MCGILGVRRSIVADQDRVERALASLAWRGPDGVRLASCGDFWLGVARLAISDPDAHQPLRCETSGRMIAFNGAVTSAATEPARDRLRTGNDAELLLARMRQRGEDGLLDQCGPYAFGLVDPGSGRLWLGRDPEGEKPLYLIEDGRQVVAFASSLRALAELGLTTRISDDERLRFVRYGFTLGAESATAGWRLHGDLRGLFVDDPADDRALRHCEGEVAERAARASLPIAEALPAAVARCASAEVGVGLALSGGIDSACLATCLPEERRGMPAYQFRADGEPGVERAAAEAVAEHCGLELRPVDGGPELLLALPELIAQAGEPLGDPSLLAAHALARAAAADGLRVLLSGEGADDLLLGYPRHRAANRLPARGAALLPSPQLSMARGARLWRALASRSPYDALLEISPPAFRRATLDLRPDAAGDLPGDPAGSALQRARELDRRFYLSRDLLPKLDVATMAAGIEGRCPFLDPEVLKSREVNAEDSRSIVGKRVLRETFEQRLPPGLFAQRKRGFALPLDRWWREDEFLPELLMDPRSLQRPWLRADGVRRMLDLHRRGRARVGHALFCLVSLELHQRGLESAAEELA